MEYANFDDYKDFKQYEFDSPDLEGSGKYMQKQFMDMLQSCRNLAGVPFIINSGYRTVNHNNYLKRQGYAASDKSYHLQGRAADIAIARNARAASVRGLIVKAAIEVGFTGIGVGGSFIHLDNGSKTLRIWTYR